MLHVSSRDLRRLADEPLAVPDRARNHLAGCGHCQAETDELAANAALAARALHPPHDVGDIDAEWAALAERLTRREAARARVRGAPWRTPGRLGGASAGTGLATVVAVVAVGAGAAAALTTIYAPTHVAPVTVSPADLRALENLTGLGSGHPPTGLTGTGSERVGFGSVSWSAAGQTQQLSSTARASALTHLAWSAPSALPPGVGAPQSIVIQPQVTASVSFDRRAGAAIAGSTLQITGGPAIMVAYGGSTGTAGPATLVVAVMQRPTASSTGATASELENFVLAHGGLPAGLTQELRLLGNPATTLPVPVPSGFSAQRLTIGGAPAVLVTTPSSAVSGVIWESKDGLVHAVGGLLDKEDILSVARQIG
jgi:hypothetical protein